MKNLKIRKMKKILFGLSILILVIIPFVNAGDYGAGEYGVGEVINSQGYHNYDSNRDTYAGVSATVLEIHRMP